MSEESQMLTEWKAHPITEAVFNDLKQKEAAIIEYILEGTCENYSEYTKQIGQLRGVQQILYVTLEDLENGN